MDLGQQFSALYHGTGADLKPGDMVTGNRESNLVTGVMHPHVYATTQPGWARVYAQYAGGGSRKYGGNPRIYEVEPTGPIEDDPTKGGKGAVRSLHPMRVVREHDVESFPEHPED
jgi:Rifampin ADP-ribosyl transferase